MSHQAKWEYLRAIYPRYQEASGLDKQRILDEFCQVAGYHRKAALRLLNGPPPERPRRPRRRRARTYGPQVIRILVAINDLYHHDLRLLQNLFLPSVKLAKKIRVTS